MTEIIIGLAVGMVCAAALLVMWRMAEKLRRELQAEEKGNPGIGRPVGEADKKPLRSNLDH